MLWTGRVLAATVCVALVGTGCQVKAHRTKAFVRRTSGISLLHSTLPPGEALIRVRNESVEPARIVLARVTDPARTLPMGADDVVPVGSAADLHYRGEGYEVLAKPDDLAPYFAKGRTSTTLHVHLERGFYVLFSNRPGHYRAGRHVVLRVA